MKKINRFWLASIVGLVSIFLLSTISYSQSAASTVQLTTNPAIDQLFPYEAETADQTPVQIMLQAVDATGKPLQNAKLDLQIFTPPRNRWMTTDFPLVEGTKLLELSTFAPEGKLQLQQMLPIRGNYQLVVDVTSTTNQFAPFQQKLTLPVQEHGAKYRNFGIVALTVLAAGLAGGWVIGGSQQLRPGEMASQRVRLLLSGAMIVMIAALFVVNLSSVVAQHHAEEFLATDTLTQQSQGLQLQISGDTEATVGQLAKLTAQLKDSLTNQPLQDVLFKIKVTSLEAGWTALSYQAAPDATGQLTWQQQFFDGAPHKIQVEVLPQPQSIRQFQPLQATQAIEVEAVIPPLTTRLTTLFYWVLFLLAGLAIGFYAQRRIISRQLFHRSHTR